jgi:multidrug efflux pump subunit AcrA (membrane-fusion protein)
MPTSNIPSFPTPQYSEETDELLGKPPAWLFRSGIGILAGVLVLFFVASWFVKYPVVVATQATFTTYNPPVSLVARNNGKIQHLLAKANDTVQAQTVIAVLENPANYAALQQLLQANPSVPMSVVQATELAHLQLGELQSPFQNYLKTLKDYQLFKDLNYNQQKISTLQQQLVYQQQLRQSLLEQAGLQKEDLQLSKRQFEADSLLRKGGAVAQKELEQAKSALLQRKQSVAQANTSIINAELRSIELQQQILDLQLKEQESITQFEQNISKSWAELQSQLEAWKQRYLLVAPIRGQLSFHQIWNTYQEVKAGEEVFSISPTPNPSPTREGNKTPSLGAGGQTIFCKTILEAQHAAKVQLGQKVVIKLAAYPFERYGILQAKVAAISPLPKEDKFTVTLALTNGLVTNYQKTLEFKPQMQGTAEIITEDLRLLERLFYQYRALWANGY